MPLKIAVLGGGPAGLAFALSMKKLDPEHQVRVYERNAPTDTFGWGVVFSGKTMSFLRDTDPASHAALLAQAQTWDNVDVVHRGELITVRGNAFCGIARIALLTILQRRCAETGVELRFRTPIGNLDEIGPRSGWDLIVGADGIGSSVRSRFAAAFVPTLDLRKNRYIWLGTNRLFHGLTLTFRPTPHGLFTAHSYKFCPTTSTFIVECPEATWSAAGFDSVGDEETRRRLAEIFRDDLDGRPLLSNNARWIKFTIVKNRRWVHENVVLLGDAAHTAHFSIGSGTKLAVESAVALARAFAAHADVPAALAAFEAARKPEVDAYQDFALSSLTWFEEAQELLWLAPIPFAYRLMTRSGKVDHQNLAARDPGFVAAYERARAAGEPT
ncbi:MAG: FAD-dependent monooxygenase [Planctomycetes bacterium]|nr:FAD-dependent monooxygenase [Planctomycetota bacterium]